MVRRTSSSILLASCLVLAFAAVTVRHLQLPLLLPGTPRTTATTHTCQATGKDRHPTGPTLNVIGTPRKTAIVACEQPPRSELKIPQSLNPSNPNMISSLG
jgi:hypothetical protein